MSHSILYDTCFVRISKDRYIPMILTGSNNCYEVNPTSGREVRTRSWENLSVKGKNSPAVSQIDMLRWVDKLLEDAERSHIRDFLLDEQFYDSKPSPKKNLGFWSGITLHGKSTHSFTDMKNYFIRAMKNALPYADLNNYGCYLQTISYNSNSGFTKSDSIKTEKELRKQCELIRNNRDLWFTFANKYAVEHLRQMQKVQSPGGKNKTYVISVPKDKSFVKNLVPLQFTQNKEEALNISLSSVNDTNIFGWIRNLRNNIDELTYKNARTA